VREPCDVGSHRGQRLAELVVQLARDARAFLFLRRDELEAHDAARLARARERRRKVVERASDAIHRAGFVS